MNFENVTIDGDTAIVKVVGRYNLIKTLKIEDELKEALNQQGCTKVVFDFSETKYSDSACNRQLKKTRDIVGAENFKVIGASGAVLRAFKTARLDVLFGSVE